MRKFSVILFILALTVAGVTLWGILGADLGLSVEGVRALPQEEYELRFKRLSEQLENGGVRGIVYENTLEGGMDDYVILEYTILINNSGLIKAQMLEALVVPLKGDVLCFSQQEFDGMDINHSINAEAGRQIRLRCYLLTRKDMHAVRDIQISYYIWGNPFIRKITYG